MSQTVVQEQAAARAGLKGDSSVSVVDSFAGEVAIPFGRFVVRGTKPTKQCKLPGAAADITDAKKNLGVAISTATVEVPMNSTAPAQYPINRTIPVMNFGRVWVETEDAATDTTKDVYVRHTASGANTKLGVFSAAAGAGLEKLENARWLGEDIMDGNNRLALLEVRF